MVGQQPARRFSEIWNKLVGIVDIQGRRIWQHASGDLDLEYYELCFSELCLKWDVILKWHARFGPWPECQQSHREIGWSERDIADLRYFCEEMEEGDLVVLSRRTKFVTAVGEIVGGYEYHEEFKDVDGWDYGHVRRVRWLWGDAKSPKEFATGTLRKGETTQLLESPDVEAWLESLEIGSVRRDGILRQLPSVDDNDVSFDDISEYLFGKGVASGLISNLMDEIGELVRIAKWYNDTEHEPSENETVNYLVVPLLRALGWTPQRMAIEWNRIDVALFSSLPREEASLSVVVEAKSKGRSCLYAFKQALYYAQPVEHCRRIIVTDGLRYAVYVKNTDKDSGEDDFSLFAYLNLTRFRREYPVYGCKGAQDALLAMTPEWQ